MQHNTTVKPFKLISDNGIAVYIGKQINTKLHVHHALELMTSFDKPFFLSSNEKEFQESDCIIIAADIPHQFKGEDDYYAFIYLDAETIQAISLEKKLLLTQHGLLEYMNNDIVKAKTSFKNWFYNEDASGNDVIEIVNELVQSIAPFEMHHTPTEPRINDALKFIKQSLHGEPSIEKVAANVFLSESRFAHLFKERVGKLFMPTLFPFGNSGVYSFTGFSTGSF